ncbi:hypothetical protein V3471_00530 [Flavobacterium oreochromis]|uniref:hypothetical protein n=1 Tax=Flavobacterium oreochromis TaxID=2906078 RepID=UPI000CDA77B3|nr:hypothetical protein BWK58_06655 [Flavobacterium columnare]
MESKAIVLSNQSLFDVAIQHTGNVKTLFDLALHNNLSITQELKPSNELVVKTVNASKEVSNYLRTTNEQPATALTQTQIEVLQPQGIGYMIIANDFIVR